MVIFILLYVVVFVIQFIQKKIITILVFVQNSFSCRCASKYAKCTRIWTSTWYLVIKGILLSKAFTCMIFSNSCIKQKCFFYLRRRIPLAILLYEHLYISHRSLDAPTAAFEQSAVCLSAVLVTSWLYSVCNIVAYWVNFR